ncbi:MAG: Zn-dependent hydrolase [Candidatus Nephthysia bennettiae]|uniref:M20 family metallo-hydrolase n=1 Tax=Candidatus Nephthysia bennettiae TaxID=3127016 RepID=A0A934KB09_9BACT|nr:M20 family metallo-hydrolase [Candidatus Dormibacteraeota bacterium]PZR94794.1 MAG: Zn-dependent hydrolase [Candidatus Dormibacteraeota bacterium]
MDPLTDSRLVERCVEELGRYGAQPGGGVRRLVYTPEWRAAADHVAGWLGEVGLEVRRDAVGNLFGVLRGSEPGPSIVTGSHIDTVIDGGRLDGALGVIAGYLALRALKRSLGRPRRTLEVLAICDEESSRFHSNFWGSRAIAGLIEAGEADSILDPEGVSLAEAMRSCGLDPDAAEEARRRDLDAFVELHIEQGPVLERAGVPVGAVTAITAVEQLECVVSGRADHAGGCPMDARLDAMLGAAEMTLAAAEEARRLGPPAVATVGRMEVRPGAPNIVAGEVRFTLDARHPELGRHQAYVRSLCDSFAALAVRRGLGFQTRRLLYQPPTASSPELVETVHAAAAALGLPVLDVVSGAGHDTQVLARAGVRRAMIFVPSIGGRSHSPEEWTSPEDMAKGVSVLTETLKRLAY